MFTGLIETIGTVSDLRQTGDSARLGVDVGAIARELSVGDSVAVSGVCLTVVSTSGTQASFDVMRETLERSGIGKLKVGDQVNIERALRPDSRLGGHFVQGHIDGVGRVSRVNRDASCVELEITADSEIMELVVPKGSIAVDGVSLTVARRVDNAFVVALIPHTLNNTTLGRARVGSEVNLETDMLGKYVRTLVRGPAAEDEGVTESVLRDAGFV